MAGLGCLSHLVKRRQCVDDSPDLGAARLDLADQRVDRSGRVGDLVPARSDFSSG